MKYLQRFLTVLILAIVVTSCGGNGANGSKSGANGSNTKGEAKYVFYFIGDGMTASQVRLAEAALTSTTFSQNYATQTNSMAEKEGLHLKALTTTGLATSNASNRYITDSAAAGTALATGSKTNVGAVSKDPEGNILPPLLSVRSRKG